MSSGTAKAHVARVMSKLARRGGRLRRGVVVDEPLYAAYLARTGIDHPAREAVIASQPTDLATAVAQLFAPLPPGRHVHYAKHMAQHVSREMDLRWTLGFRNVLLIRDPVEVVASYVRTRESCEPDDIGLPQQGWLLELWDKHKLEVPVLDARDVPSPPEPHPRWLCDWLGIPFDARMPAWPRNPRASDGVWAPHWYGSVWASTGLEPWRSRETSLSDHDAAVAETCRPIYAAMHRRRCRCETPLQGRGGQAPQRAPRLASGIGPAAQRRLGAEGFRSLLLLCFPVRLGVCLHHGQP